MAKKESKVAKTYPCAVTQCNERGRVLARLGGDVIAYCPRCRKYGERVIDFMIDSVFRNKLSKFMSETKEDIFEKDVLELDEKTNKLFKDYLKKKSYELWELDKWKQMKSDKVIREKDL